MTTEGPICRAIQIENSVGELAGSVTHHVIIAARIVDLTLELPELPPIAVRVTRQLRRGGYQTQTDTERRYISLSFLCETPRLTFIHEMAHYLDDFLGDFAAFVSSESDLQTNALYEVMGAIRSTQAVQALHSIKLATSGQLTEIRFEALRLLEAPELWARAFAQYLATTSGDATMLAEIQRRRSNANEPLPDLEYWSADDFAPVKTAMEHFVQQMGWRR